MPPDESGLPALRSLTPLADADGLRVWRRIRDHADAPAWTHDMGDRVHPEDVAAIDAFRGCIGPVATSPDVVPLARWRETVPWVRRHAPDGRAWHDIPLMGRADIAAHLDELVPLDADLSRLVHYETSGTTGAVLSLPSHVTNVATNHLLLEEALRRNGVTLEHGPRPLVAHVCAQVATWNFPAILSYWGQAGLVKVNLNPAIWSPDRARRYLHDLDPQLVTGDPVSLAEMMAWEIDVRPRALVSGAATLGAGLSRALAERYGCPVVDVYSSTEIGPIAASTPDGMRLVCPDLYVETVDGEIVVSGGRNPYLPLLRYRTGDFGRVDGEFLRDLVGRRPVWWRGAGGAVVTPIDLVRPLHGQVFSAFAFDGRVLRVRPVPGYRFDAAGVRDAFEAILAREVEVRVEETGWAGKAAEWGTDG